MTASRLLALFLALAAGAAGGSVRIVSVEPGAERVGQYERFEAAIRLSRQYGNSHDPDETAVEGRFRGPGGREVVVPAFYDLPYRNTSEGGLTFTNPGIEKWEPAGEPCFKLRFAPTEVGLYRWRIVARDAAGETSSDERSLECTPSDRRGFIRVAPGNPRAFAFDNGESFVPLGMCIAWARRNGEGDTYDRYFRRLAENGCNAVRVWMCHWAWLEWSKGEEGALSGYEGVGRYNPMVAANFDNLLELAERHGLYVMLCLNNGAWEFGRPDGKHEAYDSWGGNPYNAANGGPCQKPSEFWTHPQARKLYRRRLRYIVARWSYSTSVWAWELWNEIGQESPESADWHREMREYLGGIDPNRHLVSTSSWVDTADASRNTFGALDFSQLHYGSADAIAAMLETFGDKPLVIGEGTCDESGVGFHNSLWMSMMAGAAGPPLTWHSGRDCPVEAHDRYGHFRAVAAFLQGEDIASEPHTPLRLRVTATGPTAPGGDRYAPVVLEPLFSPWLQKARQGQIIVPPEGRADTHGLGTKLYGSNADRAVHRNPPTFVLDCPADGEFAVTVGEASGPAAVEIRVDGTVELRQELPGSGRRAVPEEARRAAVRLSAGKHEVQVSNAGADWIQVLNYVLTAYRDRETYPDLTVYALRGPRRALLWAHNTCNAPEALSLGVTPSPVRGARARVTGLPDGRYAVEEWDTVAGGRRGRRIVTCRDGTLVLELPPVETDVAIKVLPADGD